MSAYHNAEAFHARMEQRRVSPRPLAGHAVFYHAALMPGWDYIVAEQLGYLAAVGLPAVKAWLAGAPGDRERALRIAAHYGVAVEVLGTSDGWAECEGPTLGALHAWAAAHPGHAVFYHHTKGVSAPEDRHKQRWRRVMMKHVVADWRQNLVRLQQADVLGCAWQESPDYPHFCGNFWAARCDWLLHLRPPAEYRLSRPDFRWAVHSWRDRMYCETWLGSEAWHHVDERLSKSLPLWSNRVWEFDDRVPEFDFDKPLWTGREA